MDGIWWWLFWAQVTGLLCWFAYSVGSYLGSLHPY